MLTEQKILDMLKMQEALEIRIGGPNWRQAGHNYGLAIHMEAAEVIDHMGWKWWKNIDAEPNWDQIAMELVDIWHFALAHHLMAIPGAGGIEGMATELYTSLNAAVEELYDGPQPGTESLIDHVIGMGFCMMSQNQFPLGNFVAASLICSMDFDQLYLLYCCKNVLNRFRQVKGYKEGLYLKTWAGREDNEHLMDMAKDMDVDDLSFDVLYTMLEKRYQLAVH